MTVSFRTHTLSSPLSPEYHSSNEELWSHEWSKHGTCTGLSQHAFFTEVLEQREAHLSEVHAAAADASQRAHTSPAL